MLLRHRTGDLAGRPKLDACGRTIPDVAGRRGGRRGVASRVSDARPLPLVRAHPRLLSCERLGQRFGFSVSPPPRAQRLQRSERGSLVSSPEPTRPSAAELYAAEQLAVEARTQRRTALVALRGELDLVTVSKVAEVIEGLEPQADGVRHIVLDLRGLTFIDLAGLRELLRQNEYARTNRHNLAMVRGTDAIQRVLELTDVREQLVLVDDPDDLVPPASPTDTAPATPAAASFDITLPAPRDERP
jgi:anti-anti-sigma factor